LVNKTGISIHHTAKPARLFPAAFIFDERAALMVNRWCARLRRQFHPMRAREPDVKLIGLHQRIV
jgi:hypothetical protein